MYRLIKFLAVIALALSPVWGVQTVDAVNHAAYPVWPSFLSTGCNGIQGPGGSTTIACGQGAFLLSQVNSGYACTTVFISVTQYQSGPFTVVGTANSGSQTNTVSIDGTGDYYMQFPGYLTNNLIAVQISSPGGGAITIGTIGTGPCPVPPTDTPVPPTDTPNPSDTATAVPDTATPGPSQTPTAIPTFTPLPSGHNTYTPTVTPIHAATATASLTATPTGTALPAMRNCGAISFPLLNCDQVGGAGAGPSTNGTPGYFWVIGGTITPPVLNCTPSSVGMFVQVYNGQGTVQEPCYQPVTAGATGDVILRYQLPTGSHLYQAQILGNTAVNLSTLGCGTVGGSGYCAIDLGPVVEDESYDLGFFTACSLGENCVADEFYIDSTYVGSSAATSTPYPSFTPPPTLTPVPGTATDTATPAPTLVPVPGAAETAIPTSTECPGGCAVAALTAIPGLATRVLVDTSPFSELTHLSLARNTCKAFGYVQIPEPVIHGTPALGSTTPLSITWTLPVTHDWDNTNPYSNTAIQPCAMNEIPTFVWDLTYWFSVFAIFTVWIMWLLGFVGRFSGDENING